MKYNLLKSIAVIAAFLVGVAINHSCGESTTDDSVPPTMEEMWNIVRSLRTEVSTLKEQVAQLNAEVAALKSTGGGSSGNSDCGEFFVDGLYFSRAGYVTSKPKRMVSNDYTYDYYYDNQGRQIRYKYKYGDNTQIVTSEYSGKKVTTTTNQIINGQSTTSTTVYEYY